MGLEQDLVSQGGLGALASMLPGIAKVKNAMANGQVDDKVLIRMEAIIGSMTPKERAKPELLAAKRKIRVAKGSGTTVQEVNKLLKMHADMAGVVKKMKKMGGLSNLMDKLPAQFQQAASGANMDQAETQVRRMEGIINSMTAQERAKPELIKASRKRRIAAGAGVQVQEVNRMLAQYDQMQTMMKKLKGGGMMKMMRGMKGMMPGMR